MTESVVKFQDVSVIYANGFQAARAVNFEIEAGECLALIGESGSGKTTIARAALGLLPASARISGSILIGDTEVVGARVETLRGLRGKTIGFVAQSPFAAFNPLARVYNHVAEAWLVHAQIAPRGFIFDSLEKLGIADAERSLRKYPHEWSGGMLQRAEIIAARAHQPPLIVADEPTSALDASRAREILTLLRKSESALLLVSHDISLAAEHADRIAVCCAGEIVEIGAAKQIIENPQHRYTKFLLAAANRKLPISSENRGEIVLEARNLSCVYDSGAKKIEAVASANLRVRSGEITGIYGDSGAGKSTLLRLLMKIEKPSSGAVLFGGEAAANGENRKSSAEKSRAGFVMPIFQDPLASLDRRWAIWRSATEPLTARHHRKRLSKSERRGVARQILTEVGLNEIDLDARPDELSVGQNQRVCIARALVAKPKIILADEPTSALDAATSNQIIELFARAANRGIAVVIVSHDRRLLETLCHRVLKMRGGLLED